jgi:hypothetical protein
MAVVLLVVGAIVGAACALGPSPPPLWILAVLGGGVLFALELVLWGSAASGGLALGDAGRGLGLGGVTAAPAALGIFLGQVPVHLWRRRRGTTHGRS